MRQRLQAVLQLITARPEVEVRWLRTLSLLEFIGARKISRTVADRHPTLAVLEHLSDETRHASTFQRLAQELAATLEGGAGASAPHYLCPEAACAWFQTLDRALASWLDARGGASDVWLKYLLTTTLVEQRAMQLYPLYRAATGQASIRQELSQVITEEQAHRREIEQQCVLLLSQRGVDLGPAQAIEAELFESFLGALEGELTMARQAVALCM